MIAVVEAAYRLEGSDPEWLQGVCDRFQEVLRADVGMSAYQLSRDEAGTTLHNVVQSPDTQYDIVGSLRTIGTMLTRERHGEAGPLERLMARWFDANLRCALRQPATRILASERKVVGPRWVHTLGTPIKDQLVLSCNAIEQGRSTFLVGGLDRPRQVRPAERRMYAMLSAHVQSGWRLRERLAAVPESSPAPESPGEAVLDRRGRVVHAEGAAREADRREALVAAAERMGRARSRGLGRGAEALAVWDGLIDGTWSLVERFDTDGQRFIVAHRNPHRARDPRGLTPMETRVAGLASRGYADKLVAYHLGIAEGTASSHLATAMSKLGMANRAELVRRFGRFYAGDAEPS